MRPRIGKDQAPRAMKPKQIRAERSREQILQAALSLFRERGYDETTMREIADRAGVAVGAAYYYFRRKEDFVHEYYLQLESEAEEFAANVKADKVELALRLRGAIQFKIDQLSPDRALAKVLAKVAADPANELSPFSRETREVRERAVAMMASLVDGAKFRCGKILLPVVAQLAWLHYMGIIFFWVHDRSKDQKRTKLLIDISSSLFEKVLWLSSLPLTAPVNRMVVDIVSNIFGSFEEEGID